MSNARFETVREWVERLYKPSRLELDNEIPGYKETVIASHERTVMDNGLTCISRHESLSGHVEWFGRDWAPEQHAKIAQR